MFASPFTESANDTKNVDILCHTYGKKQIISLWKVLYFMWEKTKLWVPHQINHTIRTLFLKRMSILHINIKWHQSSKYRNYNIQYLTESWHRAEEFWLPSCLKSTAFKKKRKASSKFNIHAIGTLSLLWKLIRAKHKILCASFTSFLHQKKKKKGCKNQPSEKKNNLANIFLAVFQGAILYLVKMQSLPANTQTLTRKQKGH